MAAANILKYALRALWRSPGFTLTAMVALALGIGANTAIFSVVNKVLLEPLPYPEAGRLVQLMSTSPLGNQSIASIPKYIIWRDNTRVFDYMAAYDAGGPTVTLTIGARQEAVRASHVSADYFRLFGVAVPLGRTFSEAEDTPGGGRVAVISRRLWRARFGNNPGVLGSVIRLDTEFYKVIAVADQPPNLDPPADLWLPLQADAAQADYIGRLHVAARLKPGVELRYAQQVMQKTIAPFTSRFPYAPRLYMEGFTAIPLRDAMVGDVRRPLFLLTGSVVFLLLICCGNVASLLLARGTRRAREIGIRAAFGARRGQIALQLLTENVLLSLAGGLLGLIPGHLGVRELLALSPVDIPRLGGNGAAIALDWLVFLFTLAVSMLTGVAFGLLPALQTSRGDLAALVKENSAQSGMGFRRNRVQSALVISEMALALVLLAGAGLLVRTFVESRTGDRGFDEHNVVAVETSLSDPQFERTAHVAELVRGVERQLRGVPGIASVASTCALPLEPTPSMPFTIYGRSQLGIGRYHGAASWLSVSPGYFEALHIRLLVGRQFTSDDDEHAQPVMLINRAMARKFWQDVDQNPVGEYVTIGSRMGNSALNESPRMIVGIVADVRDAGMRHEPAIYVPVAQLTDRMTARNRQALPMTWVVRTNSESNPPPGEVQRMIQTATGLQVGRVRSLREVVAASSARTEFYTTLLAVFAAIALLLAAVGLYGMMAYSVEQRTREIGIRMALGADLGDVRTLVVWDGMRLALLGMLTGIPVALAFSRLMWSMILDTALWDPVVFSAVGLLLTLVAMLAAYIPSISATRVDPVEALRA